jgi:hypothetical protein
MVIPAKIQYKIAENFRIVKRRDISAWNCPQSVLSDGAVIALRTCLMAEFRSSPLLPPMLTDDHASAGQRHRSPELFRRAVEMANLRREKCRQG